MRATLLCLLSATALLAQRAGTPLYPGGAPGPRSPMPSVINPGTPTPVNRPPAFLGAPGANLGRAPGANLGQAPGSNLGRPFTGPGGGGRQQGRRTTFVPFAVPYYGGSGYYPQDEYAAQQPIVVQTAPPVVYINRDYQPEHISPQFRDYSNAPLPDAVPQQSAPLRVYDAPVYIDPSRDRENDEPAIYLIAFKDQTVIPALAYWVEGDTLRYVTRQHAVNAASLELIDRQFSMKLNRERRVEFKLPQSNEN